MQKLFERLKQSIEAFVSQRDDAALVVRCSDTDAAIVVRTLSAVEEKNESDLFWLYTDAFASPQGFVSSVVDRFEKLHSAVCEQQEESETDRWPDIPGRITGKDLSLVARLRELMMFSRSLLPGPEGHLAIWSILPITIQDPNAYAGFMSELLAHELPRPWCHHMRIIVRDDKADPVLPDALETRPRISWCQADFSGEAIEESLVDEVNDEDTPLAQRLQSLMILAGMDYAQRRYAEALEKYDILLPYFRVTENHTMSALVLNGMGEAYAGQEDRVNALKCFESALTPGIESGATPVMLNITLNLANFKLEENSWEEAEAYYDSAEKLATTQAIAVTKIQSLENRGVCQLEQGKIEEAQESWEIAAGVASGVEENHLYRNVLQRLKALHRQQGNPEKLSAVNAKLDRLERPDPKDKGNS